MKKVEEFDYILKIERDSYSARTTLGQLFDQDCHKVCETLEDTVRAGGIKVKGETALAATGHNHAYDIGLRYSPGFKRECPVIFTEAVKEVYKATHGGISFTYSMLHGGNTHKNTEGCPLVAYNRVDEDTIQGTAEKEVTALVTKLLEKGTVGLQIINNPQEN